METRSEKREDAENIGMVKDSIVDRSLQEVRSLWDIILKSSRGKITQFFIASSDQRREAIVEYLQEIIGKGSDSVIQIDADPTKNPAGIYDQLVKLQDQIVSAQGDRVLIEVDGFERFMKYWYDREQSYLARASDSERKIFRSQLWRVAHDLNQEIAETSRNSRPIRVPPDKTIVIFLHISDLLGEDIFNEGIKSAIRSRFKEDIFVSRPA